MSMFRIAMTLSAMLAGLLAGKIAAMVGMAQPWWPLSVSGEPEIVIRGELKPSQPGELTGFVLETAAGKDSIDFNRIPAGMISRLSNHKVVIRGVRRESKLSIMDEAGKYQVGSFVEASWVKTDL